MEKIKENIRDFIATNFYLTDGEPLPDEASLLDCGIIDSTGVLELVVFLEKQFGIRIPDDQILPENLDSIDRIAAFVRRSNPGLAA